MSFKILGTGRYLPENVVTNDDLAKFLDTSDEWITERTGIKERRVSINETTTDLAVGAALAALENAGVDASERDMILCSTSSGYYTTPAMACIVQQRIGATCPAMDINSACPAFLFMLDCADGYFARGRVKKMLVIGAERMSRVLDWNDRATCVIFGDGAGAVVLGEGDNYLASHIYTKGEKDIIKIPNTDSNSPFYKNVRDPIDESPYVHMKGQETFKFAVTTMCRDVRKVLAETGISEEDVKYVIPHQANLRIIEAARKRLKTPSERVYANIQRYGNTSSASIPIALDELNRAGKLQAGDEIVLAAFGAGLTSAACVIRW